MSRYGNGCRKIGQVKIGHPSGYCCSIRGLLAAYLSTIQREWWNRRTSSIRRSASVCPRPRTSSSHSRPRGRQLASGAQDSRTLKRKGGRVFENKTRNNTLVRVAIPIHLYFPYEVGETGGEGTGERCGGGGRDE